MLLEPDVLEYSVTRALSKEQPRCLYTLSEQIHMSKANNREIIQVLWLFKEGKALVMRWTPNTKYPTHSVFSTEDQTTISDLCPLQKGRVVLCVIDNLASAKYESHLTSHPTGMSNLILSPKLQA